MQQPASTETSLQRCLRISSESLLADFRGGWRERRLQQHALTRRKAIVRANLFHLAADRREILKLGDGIAELWHERRRMGKALVDDHHPARPVFVREVADGEVAAGLQSLHQRIVA